MKRLQRRSLAAMIAFWMFVLSASLSFLSTGALAVEAGSNGAAPYNVNTSLSDNLIALKGKTVTVTLSTGQTMTGTVGDVKGNLLHLVKLSQKDFYDALVVIDRISAIETKVR